MSGQKSLKSGITLILISQNLLSEGVKRYPCFPGLDPNDVDYALVSAVSQTVGKPVKIEFKKDRSPYGSYLIIGKDEYRISNRLDAWREYYAEKQCNVNPTRIILYHKDKLAVLMPYPRKTLSRRDRRKRIIEIMTQHQPNQHELDTLQREHLERVNDGYYRYPER